MIIRIGGGYAGFSEYLRTGRKQGRNQSRDQLDERVVLTGSLDLFERCVDSAAKSGDRYLHIVLSFKEDHLDSAAQRAIVEEFRRFTFCAYQQDEYLMYAESHMPRIKSYLDETTGELIERKPHVHVGIPLVNVVTGGSLNPFGLVRHNTEYVDDFQEYVNYKYGLASPKDHARSTVFDASSVLARHTGQESRDAGRRLKDELAELVRAGAFPSFEAFVCHVEQLGQTRHLYPGRAREFLHVQIPGHQKGINLSQPMFQRGFLELHPAHRKQLVTNTADAHAYRVAEPLAAEAWEAISFHEWPAMAHWHDLRAREVRYLNSGNRKRWAAYQAADPVQRRVLLQQLQQDRTARVDRCRRAMQAGTGSELLPDPPDRGGWPALPSPLSAAATGRRADHAVSQRAQDARERRERQRLLDDDKLQALQDRVDACALLASLSHSHGLLCQKYRPEQLPGQGWRIVCGPHRLTLLEFLLREMRMPADSVHGVLLDAERHQKTTILQPLQAPDPVCWKQFRAWHQERSAAGSLPSPLGWSEAEADEVHAGLAVYRDFLVEQARTEDTASLVELRRMGAGMPVEGLEATWLTISAADDGTGQTGVVEGRGLRADVQRTGAVAYSTHGRDVLVDAHTSLHVLDLDPACLEVGLRMACQRFGPVLRLEGHADSLHLAVEAVSRSGLSVTFTAPELNAALQNAAFTETEPDENRGPRPGV
jgi:hypothetical protein